MVNKSIFLSLLFIGVVGASAGAGTWAVFSDVETSAGNTFTAGTLNLTLNGENGIPGFVIGSENGVAPNTLTELADTIVVSNAGNVDGTLTASIINVADLEDGPTTDAEEFESTDTTLDPGSIYGELSDAVTIHVENSTGTVYSGLLSGFDTNALTNMDFGTLGADQTITVSYSVGNAGNEIQGDSVSFDIVFSLDQ